LETLITYDYTCKNTLENNV